MSQLFEGFSLALKKHKSFFVHFFIFEALESWHNKGRCKLLEPIIVACVDNKLSSLILV